MQKLSDYDRLLKKCSCVVERVVDALPLLLSKMEPEDAAKIVAELAKSVVNKTSLKILLPEEDHAKALQDLVDSFGPVDDE